MGEPDRRRRLPATSADAEAARAVDRLLQRLIVLVEEAGPEEVLEVLLEHLRASGPEEGP